jgi:hypothetical protein
MSRLKTAPVRRKRAAKKNELTLQQALERLNDAEVADSLSLFFATLARAQRERDEVMIHESNRAIAEAMRGMPEGEFDEPLLPLRRKRMAKRRR